MQPVLQPAATDPLRAALTGACGGEFTLGQIVGALAMLLEVEASSLRAEVIGSVRGLALQGFLTFP